MKKVVIQFLLIMAFYSVNGQLPSNCDVPEVLQKYYVADVNNMALKWLYDIKSPDTGLIDIPQWCQDTVWRGISAIFNRHDQPEVDSIFNKYCVHTDIGHSPVSAIFQTIVVQMDTTYSWTKNWINFQIITGIPSLDALLARYGFTLTNIYWYTHTPPCAILTTTELINVFPLCDSLKSFPGIISAGPEVMASTGAISYIAFSDTGNVKYYTFSLGWGTASHRNWSYKVNPDCSIEFLGTQNSGQGSGYSNPVANNCNILNIPQIGFSNPEVRIFPNPANDFVTISVNYPEVFSFRIIDYFGKTVLCGNGKVKCQVNLSGLSRGLYLVQVLKDNALISNNKLVRE